jgi:DNA-binding transcriptional LysR family regulator
MIHFLAGDERLTNRQVFMELREMRSAVLLAENGSIQEAAAAANLSPAAVHKHLKTLGKELGTRLYERQDGRLVLSEAGSIALPFFTHILNQCESVRTAISEWKNAHTGIVRVGAGPTFSTHLLPGLVRNFRRRFPGVEVFVEAGNGDHLMARLHNGHLDLIFDVAAAAMEHPNLERVAVWEAPMAFVAGRQFLPARCSVRELAGQPFILFQKGSPVEQIVRHYLNQIGIQPKVVMRSDSSEAIKAMIRVGQGISVLFVWNITADPRSAAFRLVHTDAPKLVSHMAIIRMKGCYTSRPVNEFIKRACAANWKQLHPVSFRDQP